MAKANADTEHGLSTSWRVEKPEGSVLEILWKDDGRVAVTNVVGAERVEITTFELGSDGTPRVLRVDGSGCKLPQPVLIARTMNPYGVSLEDVDAGDLGTVRYQVGDNGRCDRVSIEGRWGRQTLDLHADGGRRLTWWTQFHQGHEVWDAAGRRCEYDVDYTGRDPAP